MRPIGLPDSATQKTLTCAKSIPSNMGIGMFEKPVSISGER